MIDTIEELAKEFHEIYFDNLTQYVKKPEWEDMPEHQVALRAALYKLIEEGKIIIGDGF